MFVAFHCLSYPCIRSFTVVASVVFLLGITACQDDGTESVSSSGSDTLSSDGTAPANPVYAVESLVFGDQGRSSYIALLPSLENQPLVELANAREFPEYAPADAHNGTVVVGSGETPTLTRYEIGADLSWTQGQTISFMNFTSEPLDASLYVAPDKAYVPFEHTNFLSWNPLTFSLGVALGAPAQIPLTRGDSHELALHRGYAYAQRGATLFQPYYWSDESFHRYSQTSQVSVIDTATDTVKAVFDVPCPHLHITSQDDAGTVYLSNGQGSIAAAVLDPAHPRNCFATINPDAETSDPTKVVYFRDLAEGREGSNLFNIGQGMAFFNVYHAERDNITADTPFETVDYSSNFHLWTLNLQTMQAKMMEGIDFAGGQFVAFRLDGRTYVTIPAPDYSRTAVYEVFVDGRAEKRFDVQGWAFKMFRVR